MFVPVVTEPVLWKAELVLGVVVSSGVDHVLVGLVPGTEVVGDAPAVGEPRPEVLRAVPGMVLLVAVVMDSIPVVTETGAAGLVPAVPVPRNRSQQAAFVVEAIEGEGSALRAEESNPTDLWWWWEERW